MRFLTLLRRLSRLSNAVDTILDRTAAVATRKAAIVTATMTTLSIVEDKLKRDIANDVKVKAAAAHLAEAVFEALDAPISRSRGTP